MLTPAMPVIQQPTSAGLAIAEAISVTASNVSVVEGLLERLLPAHAQIFTLHLVETSGSCARPKPFFRIKVTDGNVHITGTSCVELASGVHWFLKYFAQCSISWDLTGGVQVGSASLSPECLAVMAHKGTVTVERAVPFSFYQNVVTLSYSMAFWEWERWEAELDWMALQGINLPLMPLGMEALQVATFTSLGLSDSQLQDFFPGPAFLAWGRMGNLQGYAGPLPAGYMEKQMKLAQRVVQRMREFGMNPVYPAFAGFVPAALSVLHPEAAVTPASDWCHFPSGYCCPHMLDPSDPLFATIGSTYIRTLREHLGWDTASYYIADSFNEMKPSSDSPEYLAGVSASVFAGMTAADPNATWIMQAWLFFSDSRFWQPAQIQALLSGVPQGRLVLLDLFAEEHPIWTRTAALYGHPFIWCMLHNFGGNSAMYGALPAVAEGVSSALQTAPDNLIGIGMTPEGIEQNPAVYEFMAEMAYKGRAAAAAAPGGLRRWFSDYACRRYAAAGALPSRAVSAVLDQAWQLLAHSVYSCRDKLHNTVCDIPTSRPGLSRSEIMGWGLAPHLWYNVNDVRMAWQLLLQAVAAAPQLITSSAFVYDLLDVSRELLSKIAGRFWADAVAAYQAGNLSALRSSGGALVELLADMDALLGSHKGFLLGAALQRARGYASGGSSTEPAADSSQQQQLAAFYDWNLRTQLTIWGTSNTAGDSEVSDYASKEWSGLIASFYLPRWRAWLRRLEQDLLSGRPYDAAAWRLEVLMMTYRWISTGTTDDGSSSSSHASDRSDAMNVDSSGTLAEQLSSADEDDSCCSCDDSNCCGAFAGAAVSVQEVAAQPQGDPVQLSSYTYQRYGRLVAPVMVPAPAMAAAAAAAVVAGAAGAAVAAVTAAGSTAVPVVPVVEEIVA